MSLARYSMLNDSPPESDADVLKVPVTCPLDAFRLDYADNGPLAGVFDQLGID